MDLDTVVLLVTGDSLLSLLSSGHLGLWWPTLHSLCPCFFNLSWRANWESGKVCAWKATVSHLLCYRSRCVAVLCASYATCTKQISELLLRGWSFVKDLMLTFYQIWNIYNLTYLRVQFLSIVHNCHLDPFLIQFGANPSLKGVSSPTFLYCENAI